MRRRYKIVVTGGAGFIGSHFIKYLLKKEPDFEIFNFDSLTYAGDVRRLNDIKENPRYHFIKLDIRNMEALFSNLRSIRPNFIFHFASETHVDNSIKRPADFISTNIIGTFNLLEYIRLHKSRLIHISTDEIYGDRNAKRPLFSETDNYNPSSPYSASKASQEMLVRSYIRTYKIDAIIIRPCNHFGPFQHREKFIPKCIINAINNKPVPVYGDGRNRREWIYVEDGCRAIYQIFRSEKYGEVFNIGSGFIRSNIEIAKEILRLTSRPEGLIKFVKDRPGHDLSYGVNFEKLQKLGFRPETSLIEGLKKTIDWYKENMRFVLADETE